MQWQSEQFSEDVPLKFSMKTRFLYTEKGVVLADYRKGYPEEETLLQSGSGSMILSLLDGHRSATDIERFVAKQVRSSFHAGSVINYLEKLFKLGIVEQTPCKRRNYQVLVIPWYQVSPGHHQFVVLKRDDLRTWQWVAGGVDAEELPSEAAHRELLEETGLVAQEIHGLDSTFLLPGHWFRDLEPTEAVLEHHFLARVTSSQVLLSNEHSEFKLLNYRDALRQLTWDSNKSALQDAHRKLLGGDFAIL